MSASPGEGWAVVALRSMSPEARREYLDMVAGLRSQRDVLPLDRIVDPADEATPYLLGLSDGAFARLRKAQGS